MWHIGIADDRNGRFIETARERFSACATFAPYSGVGDGFDAVVITDAAPDTVEVACPTVLLPGTRRGVLTDSAITYGMSPRDTATISSVSEGRVVVSLQRDIRSFAGRSVVRQEFDFSWLSSVPDSAATEALPLAVLGLMMD